MTIWGASFSLLEVAELKDGEKTAPSRRIIDAKQGF